MACQRQAAVATDSTNACRGVQGEVRKGGRDDRRRVARLRQLMGRGRDSLVRRRSEPVDHRHRAGLDEGCQLVRLVGQRAGDGVQAAGFRVVALARGQRGPPGCALPDLREVVSNVPFPASSIYMQFWRFSTHRNCA